MGLPTEVLACPVSRSPELQKHASLWPLRGHCPELVNVLKHWELIHQVRGEGVCVGRWVGEDLEGAQAAHQAGQMALHTLHCCGSLQDSAHTASALVGCSDLGNSPRGPALLSQPCPTKSTALSVLYKVTHAQPLPHGSCATWHWPGSVYSGISLWPHPGQVSTHVLKLEGWQLGDPGLWRGCHSPRRGLLGAGVPGECTVWPPVPG